MMIMDGSRPKQNILNNLSLKDLENASQLMEFIEQWDEGETLPIYLDQRQAQSIYIMLELAQKELAKHYKRML